MTGTSYSPILHEDELLYSWVGRLARFNADYDPRELMDELFANRNALMSVDLPCRLLQLSFSLESRFPYVSVEQAIELGTLYPFHRPFISIEKHEMALQKILHGGGGLKIILGRVANRFGATHPLQTCPVCAASDIASWGYGIWRRSHNLPGITCCVKHAVSLVAYSNPSKQSHRAAIIWPQVSTEDWSLYRPSRAQLRMAYLCSAVLNGGFPAIDSEVRATVYRKQASAKGYFCGDHLLMQPLVNDISERYDGFDGFDFKDRIWATKANPMRWLRDLFAKPFRSLHPICHIILIDLLWENFKEFNFSLQEVLREQDPNFSSNVELPLLKSIDSAERKKSIILDVTYSCRTAANLAGVSTTTVVQHRLKQRLMVSLRPQILTANIRHSIATELIQGHSTEAVAEKIPVSLSSIYRIRALIRAELSVKTKEAQKKKHLNHRDEWIKLLTKLRDVTASRKKCPALYAWLYRNDRSWLLLTNASFRRPHRAATSVDWFERDRQLCNDAKLYFRNKLRDANRYRFSQSSLMRSFDETMIRRNITKLPMLRLFLDRACESIFQYQKLRIVRAIHQLLRLDLPLDAWRIQRIAGLKTLEDEHLKFILNRRI